MTCTGGMRSDTTGMSITIRGVAGMTEPAPVRCNAALLIDVPLQQGAARSTLLAPAA